MHAFLDQASEWSHEQHAWRSRIAKYRGLTMMSTASADAVSFGDEDPAEATDHRSVLDAIRALGEAFGGNSERALAWLAAREERRPLDLEPEYGMFTVHAFVRLCVGQTDRLAPALRRRLIAARIDDRQDQIQLLALFSALDHVSRGEHEQAFAVLEAVEVEPLEVLRPWFDAVRVIAHILAGNLSAAARTMTGSVGTNRTWMYHSFALLHETAAALFDLAEGRNADAAQRALHAIESARLLAPAQVSGAFWVAYAAGHPVDDLVARMERVQSQRGVRPRTDFARQVAERRERDQRLPLNGHVSELTALTEREKEIVTMAANGRSNPDIAARLSLSIRTVESHLHHARGKLGMLRTDHFSTLAVADVRPRTTDAVLRAFPLF